VNNIVRTLTQGI